MNREQLAEEIIETLLPHITCHHDIDRDEDGTHEWVEYDVDEQGKAKLVKLLEGKL